MELENLKSRIKIRKVNVEVIAYLYNRQSFDLLKIASETYDKTQWVKRGDIVDTPIGQSTVEDVQFFMFDQMQADATGFGYNQYSPTDELGEFNLEIVVTVK